MPILADSKAVLCSMVLFGPLFFVSCSDYDPEVVPPATISSSQLIIDDDGRAIYIGSQVYYSGTVIDRFGDGVTIRYRAPFDDGYRHGEESEHYQDGKPVRKCHYEHGKKKGLEYIWYANGREKSVTNFVNNLPEGQSHHWDTNGLKTLTSVFTNGVLLSHQSFHSNGKPKRQSIFADGHLNGLSQQWYENGQLEWAASFLTGRKHGTATGWTVDGKKSFEAEWKRGLSHGLSKKWYPNGITKNVTTFQNGQKDGEAIGAYENGVIEWEAHWRTNALHGVHREWHPDGKRKLERIYLKNKKLSEYRWPATGNAPDMERFGYGQKLKWTSIEFLKFRGLDCAKIHFALGAPNKVAAQDLTYWNLNIRDSKNKRVWQEATFTIQSNRVASLRFANELKEKPARKP
jgi:antitoxin component YwqK of YwqJK toxin-antitoxin module